MKWLQLHRLTVMHPTQYSQPCLHTAFVSLPLLNLECQVKGADRKVDSLGIHSSHLEDKRGSPISFQRLPLRERHSETDRRTDRLTTRDRKIMLVPERSCWYNLTPPRWSGDCLRVRVRGVKTFHGWIIIITFNGWNGWSSPKRYFKKEKVWNANRKPWKLVGCLWWIIH